MGTADLRMRLWGRYDDGSPSDEDRGIITMSQDAIERHDLANLGRILATYDTRITNNGKLILLSHAARVGSLATIRALLEKFRDYFQGLADDRKGFVPVHEACMGGRIDVLELFKSCFGGAILRRRNEQRRNILHVAAVNRLHPVVHYLLDELQLADVSDLCRRTDALGKTALVLATDKHYAEIAALIRFKMIELQLL